MLTFFSILGAILVLVLILALSVPPAEQEDYGFDLFDETTKDKDN